MKNRILVVAFACVSVLAAAQSGTQSNTQPASAAKETRPRDLATGQASGKIVSQPASSHATLNSSENVTAPRDLATGQASGKRQHEPIRLQNVTEQDGKAQPTNNGQTNRESSAPSVSEIVVTKPGDRKTTAQDDWQTPAKTQATQTSDGSTNQWPSRVATGDVNGDGKADVAINNSHSNVKDTKDVSTGQATGKRQHEPLTIKKEVGASSPAK